MQTRGHRFQAVVFNAALSGPPPDRPRLFRIIQHLANGLGQLGRLAGFHQQPRISQQLRNITHAGGNDRFDRSPRGPKLVGGGFKPHAPKRRG